MHTEKESDSTASDQITAMKALAKHPACWALLALVAASLIAFGNALPNSFHFDDIVGVARNPAIRDLKNIPAFFTDPSTFGLGRTREWRPILQITYALDYAIGGLNPAVFHGTNLLFHLGTAFWIFLIVTAIYREPAGARWSLDKQAAFWPALFAALLFTVHPANTEAVDYIWARSSLLATFFSLMAFYCYLQGPFGHKPEPGLGWHAGGLVCFALGMATKATAVTLPALLITYEFLLLNPRQLNPFRLFVTEPKRTRKYVPLALLALAYIALRLALFPRMVTSRLGAATPRISSYAYLLTQFRAWIYYVRLFLWPHPLMMDFPGFGWSHSLWDIRVLASLALIMAVLIFSWRMRKSHPRFSLFVWWYFIALLPEASIIPLEDAVVGYRAYPAYAGLSAAFVTAAIIGGRWIRHRAAFTLGRKTFWLGCSVLGAVILILLTISTIVRNRDWRSETTLWNDVKAKDPTNPRPYMALGLEHLIRGDYGAAEELFDKAIQLSPRAAHAFVLRGYLKFRQDRNRQALDDFAAALELDPRAPYAFFYRGELYRKIGESDKALADYRAALKFMPYYTDAELGMAMAYLDKNDIDSATKSCRRMTEIDPEDRRGYDCLGTLLLAQNRVWDAVRVYRQGVSRHSEDIELWHGLAASYEKAGMSHQARDALSAAAQIPPAQRGAFGTETPVVR